jgi:hypothetical protein
MNSSTALEEAILDTELRHINFFNGRLLTGGDLEAEQSVQHTHSRHLGMAVGAGVAFGLEVAPATDSSPGGPILKVTAGLAVNRAGQTLRLECDQRVALMRPSETTAADECIFNDCDPKAAGATLKSGIGFYVLLIAPASKSEGLAPVSGLGNDLALCNSRYLTEGVKFRLLRLNVNAGTDANKVRNVVAYQCFGVPGLTSNDFVQNALNGTQSPVTGLKSLVPTGYLTANDVPLAIIEWNTTGLGFVDQWSVRRRLTKCGADTFWEPLIGDRRLAEREATFFQFQDQINRLTLSVPRPDQIRLVDQFRYVPAVGFVPLAQDSFTRGFHPDLFFDTLTLHTDVFIEGARIEQLLRASFNYPPVDLNAPDRPVMLWVYKVREDRQVKPPAIATGVQPYLVFSSGHMPYMADPHFDVNRWEYSNYP